MSKVSFTVVRLGGAALIWADRPLGGSIATKLHQALTQLVVDRQLAQSLQCLLPQTFPRERSPFFERGTVGE